MHTRVHTNEQTHTRTRALFIYIHANAYRRPRTPCRHTLLRLQSSMHIHHLSGQSEREMMMDG